MQAHSKSAAKIVSDVPQQTLAGLGALIPNSPEHLRQSAPVLHGRPPPVPAVVAPLVVVPVVVVPVVAVAPPVPLTVELVVALPVELVVALPVEPVVALPVEPPPAAVESPPDELQAVTSAVPRTQLRIIVRLSMSFLLSRDSF
jgi:hypothetical protein